MGFAPFCFRGLYKLLSKSVARFDLSSCRIYVRASGLCCYFTKLFMETVENADGCAPLSVLLVDDNPDDILLVRENVRLFHFPIDFDSRMFLPAHSPAKAPDVVLLDMNLVESRGFSTLARARDLYPKSAIILLTGHAQGTMQIDCLKYGAQDFLVKGHFDEIDLEKAIRFAYERNVQRLELVDSSTALKLVLDSHPIGLLVLSEDLLVKECNPAACELLGRTAESLIGTASPVPAGVQSPGEFQLTDASGKTKTLELRIARPAAGLDSSDTFVALTDVTLRKSHDQEIADKEKLETVSRVCYGVAHEFNNLLAITRTKTDFLDTLSSADPVWSAHIGDLKHACERGARLVSQLMTFYGKPSGDESLVEISSLLKSMEPELRLMCGLRHRIELVGLDSKALIKSRRSNILKILTRLVSNACDAMPSGGCVRLVLEEGDAVGFGDRGSYLCLSVEDTGIGIPLRDQSKIFEPFFTTKDTKAGRGLGLSVVSNLLREDDGWIEFDSEKGVGSKFRVYLPICSHRSPAVQEPPRESPVKSSIQAKGRAPLVLVVDDEPIIRFSVQRLLEYGDYRVLTAENGSAALEILEERSSEISLLLTDLNMPLMHGKELANRASYLNPDLRIVIMSGFGSSGIDEGWLKQKQAVFVAKPFTKDKLLSCISNSLSTSVAP